VTGAADPVRRKIHKLLAKADQTDSDPERLALIAKATEIATRHGIDLLLRATESDERLTGTVGRRRYFVDAGPYQGPLQHLYSKTAEALDVGPVVYSGRPERDPETGRRRVFVEIWGIESDLEHLDDLVTSLLLQSARALERSDVQAAMEAEVADGVNRVVWRNAFRRGFADQTAAILRRARKETEDQAERETTGSVALALRDRSEVVEGAFQEEYLDQLGRRRPTTAGLWGGSGSLHGEAAGRRADLGATSITADTKGLPE